ncbi:MAG: T9SS type A sorting domain-containing protein [Bacteroidota bacterium]
MKTFYSLLMLMICCSSAFSQKQSIDNTSDNTWLNKVQKNIQESEYCFKQDKQHLRFNIANQKQHIGASITSTGYTVFPLKYFNNVNNKNDWQQTFYFKEIRKGNMHLLASTGFSYSNNKSDLNFSYKNFIIQYTNSEKGLRQNFIVLNKPEGQEDLEVILDLKGDLFPSLVNNGIQFKNKAGETKLFYQDLNVWDADKTPIKARMELRENDQFAIIVNDQDAKYPLTIDPINQTPEWIGSAEGIIPGIVGSLAIDAAYGFSVAGLGDVNGDGFDDIAVGSPTCVDIISPTVSLANVGAVFIYYGSISGLATTPSVVLRPSTPIAGALFGYSIAGGDINADNKSDIIVGAPMDVVEISAGGPSTASGTIGKVYVFDGATLSTSTDTLLTLSLNGDGILEHNINLSVNALFGFSVAVTEDLNNDTKKDIIVGAPTYAGIKTILGVPFLDVQSGGAFVFLSNGNDPHVLVKLNPFKASILGTGILANNIDGLLFGYCVDGLGDYNNDGKYDVIASSPAGINLSSVSALLNGKLLQGSATIYYGNGSGVSSTAGATLTATSGGLLSNLSGSIANIANLFGICVKGVRNSAGVRNGNVLVGAPLGGTIINVLGLDLKTGTVNVFKKKNSSPSSSVSPDQVLSSPRNNNSILSIIQANLLFGYSIDNTLDLNCDGFADIIIGEPASSGLQLLNTNVAGGSAYIYFGKANGMYQTTNSWELVVTEDAFLGVNATSLIGYSVAGAGRTRGVGFENRVLVGTPSRTLDFGSGLLNLGATFGNLFSLTLGHNGVGKAYLFNSQLCGIGSPLPVTLSTLKGLYANGTSRLTWSTAQEINSSYFEVEHSLDGITFTTINKINAAGNSNIKVNYEFTNNTVSPGSNYYRLKMIDKNGSYEYTNIIVLNVIVSNSFITTVYPSPFINSIYISMYAETNGLANTKLFDNTGRLIANKSSLIQKGVNTLILNDLEKLNAGAYTIQIQTGNEIITKKLLK